MKNALKVLALGVAIAASATMAKADTITGSVSIAGTQVTDNGTGLSFTPSANPNSPSSNAFAYNASGTFANFVTPPASTAAVFDFGFNATNNIIFAVGSSASDYIAFYATDITTATDVMGDIIVKGKGYLVDTAGDTQTDATFSLSSATDGNISYTIDSSAVAPTPEPSSLALLGTGLLGAAGIARRRFLGR